MQTEIHFLDFNKDWYVDEWGVTSLIKAHLICNKGPIVCILIYLRTQYGWQLQFLVGFVLLCTIITMHVMHNTVRESLLTPRKLIQTIIVMQHIEALILVHVQSHSCGSLQCDSVRSGSNQRGRNATSHPYPWPSAAAVAVLSDWSVWHANHFQNPNRAAKKLKREENYNRPFESTSAVKLYMLQLSWLNY